MDWLTVAIQAGGAIGVCGMFLWFLNRKQLADDSARKEFLEHQATQNVRFIDHLSERQQAHLDYLRDRDAQSKTVAKEGYSALMTVAKEIRFLRERMITEHVIDVANSHEDEGDPDVDHHRHDNGATRHHHD